MYRFYKLSIGGYLFCLVEVCVFIVGVFFNVITRLCYFIKWFAPTTSKFSGPMLPIFRWPCYCSKVCAMSAHILGGKLAPKYGTTNFAPDTQFSFRGPYFGPIVDYNRYTFQNVVSATQVSRKNRWSKTCPRASGESTRNHVGLEAPVSVALCVLLNFWPPCRASGASLLSLGVSSYSLCLTRYGIWSVNAPYLLFLYCFMSAVYASWYLRGFVYLNFKCFVCLLFICVF